MESKDFWINVDIKELDDCWEWKRGMHSNGYGAIYYEGKNTRSHIVAWILTHPGEVIPFGWKIIHSCDNPPCCNPHHIFLGTQKDNMQDMMNRGRNSKEKNNRSYKLTENQVIDIREKYSTGKFSQREIAREYGVHQITISRIVRRESWELLNPKAEFMSKLRKMIK